MTAFEVIDEVFERHASATEAGRSVHDVGIGGYRALFRHLPLLYRWPDDWKRQDPPSWFIEV